MYDKKRIQTEMQQKGMYQKDIAEKTGLAPGTISRLMLSGRARIETVQKVAEVLEVDFSELVKDGNS